MTDDENLRKRCLLEDFAAAHGKLRELQEAARKAGLGLQEIADYLGDGGDCQCADAMALEEYLSGPLRDLIRAIQEASDEKEILQEMLADIGIKDLI